MVYEGKAEGIFRKSCEHTLRVMHLHSDHILVILDVGDGTTIYYGASRQFEEKASSTRGDVGNIKLQPLDDVMGSRQGYIQPVGEKLWKRTQRGRLLSRRS